MAEKEAPPRTKPRRAAGVVLLCNVAKPFVFRNLNSFLDWNGVFSYQQLSCFLLSSTIMLLNDVCIDNHSATPHRL